MLNKTTGKWSGLLSYVQDKKVDLIESLLTMDKDRNKILDFLFPIFVVKRRMYFKLLKTPTIKWSAYFEVRYVFMYNLFCFDKQLYRNY